jgi:hypothetical protein
MVHMNKLSIPCAALAVLGIGALTLAGNASAQQKKPVDISKIERRSPVLPACASVQAAKTQTLATGQISVEASSTSVYGSAGCNSFVVDTLATSASTPSGKYSPDFVFKHEPGVGIGAPDKAKCESTIVTVQYFKKIDGQAAFIKLGGGSIKGKWNAGNKLPCSLNQEPGFQNPPAQFKLPAAGKTDTYRIAISYKQLNQIQPVSAGLAHVPFGPG